MVVTVWPDKCLDWTERRPHLAGPVGAQLFKRWYERGWLERDNYHLRLVKVTALGQRSLGQELGLTFCDGATVDMRRYKREPISRLASEPRHRLSAFLSVVKIYPRLNVVAISQT